MEPVDLTPAAAVVAWHGAISVEELPGGRGLSAWRLDHERRHHFAPSDGALGLLDVAMAHAGVRLVFRSSATSIRLVAAARSTHMECVYDLRSEGVLIGTVVHSAPNPIAKPWHQLDDFLASDPAAALVAYSQETERSKAQTPPLPHTVTFDGLSGTDRVYELWLPHTSSVGVISLEVSAGATIQPHDKDRRPRWITHGSSITHCSEAHSPSRTWPATAARLADLNLLGLGYGGQCHLDQSIARMIRDQPAEAISLKLGINLHNMTSATHRTFAPMAMGFIQTIREGHPNTPILIVSPIWGAWREHGSGGPNPFVPMEAAHPMFPTLVDMRSALERVVALLVAEGDRHLFYISGLELFSEADQGMMPDLLHPNGDGYELMGQRFAKLAFGKDGLLLPGRLGSAGAVVDGGAAL